MSKQPSHHVYYVKDQKGQSDDEKSKGIWTKIGAAWKHKDGKGFSLELELIPVTSGDTLSLTLREPKEQQESSDKEQQVA